jgi:uncharacterized protein (TIGR02466 family)
MSLNKFHDKYQFDKTKTVPANAEPASKEGQTATVIRSCENILFADCLNKYEYTGDLETPYLRIQKEEWGAATISNMQSKNNFLLEESEFAGIKSFIQEKIVDYVENTLELDVKLRITQSWANYNKTDAPHHPHTHPNSIISGVLYFYVDEDTPPITFIRPYLSQFSFPVKNANVCNSSQMEYKPAVGTLILFPSYLMHCVVSNKSKIPRVSLSFNTFAVGSLGSKQSLTYLDLP